MVQGASVVVAADTPVETEVFGVTYERYALQELCARLVEKLNLHSVIEMPASGAKAMPSLYSLGFALAGCQVALVNADPDAERLWYQLGLADRLTLLDESEIAGGSVSNRRWDLCWNFAVLPLAAHPEELLQRMGSLSREWLLVVGVNRFNIGFPIHRAMHRCYQIPWTHGDLRFFSPFDTCAFLRSRGFRDAQWGVLDCPPWPDSLGFRDVRLHRQGESRPRWISPYADYLRSGRFPLWMKMVHAGERLPLPALLKLPYAHLFYAYCRVDHESDS